MAGTTTAELQAAIKSMASGMWKGNTADTLGAPIDLLNTAIKPVTERLGIATDTPFGGSGHFRTMFGMELEDENVAETAGSMISIGGLSKAMIVGAARLGKAVDTEKATELLTKHPEVKPASVYNMTGVYKGEDGKLRAVISDKAATSKVTAMAREYGDNLENVLDHPELYKAYPELRDYTIEIGKLPAGSMGSHNKATRTIEVSKDLDEAARNKVLMHEVQHAIQSIEGFGSGGNPKQFLPRNIEAQAKALQGAVARGRQSADTSLQDAAERFKERFNTKIQDAHVNYENIPGEQEARYTEATKDYSKEELAANVRRQLQAGVTPQSWDRQDLPSIAARQNAARAEAEAPQQSTVLDKIKQLIGD